MRTCSECSRPARAFSALTCSRACSVARGTRRKRESRERVRATKQPWAPPKRSCAECNARLVQARGESNGTFSHRMTCMGRCQALRVNRLVRASRQRAYKNPNLTVPTRADEIALKLTQLDDLCKTASPQVKALAEERRRVLEAERDWLSWKEAV